MLSLPALCDRRQFQLYLLAGLCLCQTRSATARMAAGIAAKSHLVRANNAFALSLLRELEAQAGGDNQFFSPFSIESALSIALEGARGQTALEMGQALQYPAEAKRSDEQAWDMQSIRTDFRNIDKKLQPVPSSQAQSARDDLTRLLKQLHEVNDAVELLQHNNRHREAAVRSQEARKLADRANRLATQIDQFEFYNANSIWLDASYPLSKEYERIIDDFYGSSGTFNCDFQRRTDAERQRINRWVSEQTRDKIKDIIPPGALTTLTRLVIANAIYFKGTWSKPFDSQQTKLAPFTTSALDQVDAALMKRSSFDAGRYAAFNSDGSPFETPKMVGESFKDQQGYPKEDGFQIAELPYNGDALSMMILLPRKADGLRELLRTLTAEKLQQCVEHLDQRTFHVSLPKFKLETTYQLNETLQQMGMKQAFDSVQADFSGLTDSREVDHELHVSLVLHKAFVDVNEQGTEAAAATIVALDTRAALIPQRPFIPSFTADHPFLFVIRDRSSGMILFIGKVEKP